MIKKKDGGRSVGRWSGKILENGERAKMEVKVGDKVLFEKWGGEEVKMDG